MNENDSTKKFFEKLAGVNSSDDDLEFEPRLAKADLSAPKNHNKKTKKNSGDEKSVDAETAPAEADEFDDFEGQLTIDVYQTPANIVIESTIAGVEPDDLDISITSDSVTIKGERRKEEKAEKRDYLFQECFWGKFSRSVILPQEVDPDKAEASVKRGILKIVLPKLHKQKSRKLRVKFD